LRNYLAATKALALPNVLAPADARTAPRENNRKFGEISL
jgi:hypothetical protein